MNKFSEKLAKALKKNPRPREADEAKFPWLSIILDTYHIFDTGLRIELAAEEEKRQSRIACHQGCVACCLRPEVPATQLEVMGLWWFVIARLDSDTDSAVSQRLLHRQESLECPFLLGGGCTVYPMRPLACRLLHAFGSPCPTDKIIIEAKAKDIWTPSREVVRKAAMSMLTYYGFKHTKDKVKAFNEGFIIKNSPLLARYDWESLVLARGEK